MTQTFPSTSGFGIRVERDEKGRIVRRCARRGSDTETRCYAYDCAGRLARVTDERGSLLESYLYDGAGRRLADINPQRFRGERRFGYAAGDRLSQAGRVLYGHDAAGYRCRKTEAGRETRYEYEPSGLLLAVELPGEGMASARRIKYAYDADGLRREKRVDGRLAEAFSWLNPLRLQEFFDRGAWWRLVYDPERDRRRAGRAPVGVTNGSDAYLIVSDQLGTALALADLDGNVVQAMWYDAFGNLLATRGDAVRLPLGFAGGLFDADTGLTRFVWRDYDADTGRFTARDPLGARGGDKDWYGYCMDDPVNRVDAWGLESGETNTFPLPLPMGEGAEKSSTGREDNPYCKVYPCDEQGTMQGDYKPIDGHPGAEPFMTDFTAPLPDILAGPFRGDDGGRKAIRVPLGVDILVDPFRSYYERNKK